jgi:hypothetical protein
MRGRLDYGLCPAANSGINSVEPSGPTTKGLAAACLDDSCYMRYPSPSSSHVQSYNNAYHIPNLCYLLSHTKCIYSEDIYDSKDNVWMKNIMVNSWWDTVQIATGQDFNLDSGYLKYSCLPFWNLTFSGFTALVTRLIKTVQGGSCIRKFSHLLLFTKVCQIVDWNTDAIPKTLSLFIPNLLSWLIYCYLFRARWACIHACTHTHTRTRAHTHTHTHTHTSSAGCDSLQCVAIYIQKICILS